jgi:branched-chain amino acid transport system substrate-binding protein
VIIDGIYLKKAIPAILAGIAFFFPGCYPSVPVKKELPKKAMVDLLAQAEAFRQSGRFEEALQAYGAIVEGYPEDEISGLAIHRMAEINLATKDYQKALRLLQDIPEKYPSYEYLPAARYQIAKILYLLGEYQRSNYEALSWVDRYPGHYLMGATCLLIGDTFKALQDNPQAFSWWLKAKDSSPEDLQLQEELRTRLDKLIETSNIEDLKELPIYATGTEYAPRLYHQMATIFMEKNQLEEARIAASALVSSSQEESWISLGRQILEKIREELSVNKGVVGCLLPLSGPFAIYGEEVLNGILLGIGISSQPNQEPGLELALKDTAGEPEQALAGLEELVGNEKVIAIIGPLSSKVSIPVALRAETLGIPIVTLTQKAGVAEYGEMVFRNFLTPSREAERLLDAAIGEMGIRRFGILCPRNYYGQFFMNLFWDGLEERGGIVTAVEHYDPEETDFAAQIKKMTGLYYPRPESLVQKLREMWPPEQEESEIYPEKPEPITDFEAVFIPDNFQRVAMIAPQLAYQDVLGVLLIGTSLWQSPQLIEMAGDYVQGAIFPSGFFEGLKDPLVNAFCKDYSSNFDSTPGILAATGYDTIRLFQKIISEKSVRTRKDFQRALLNPKDFEGITGKTSFDRQGEVQKEPLLLTISGKRMVVLPQTPIQ